MQSNILVDFPMLYNTDLGVLKYFITNAKKSFLSIDTLPTDYFLSCLICTRQDSNPLKSILQEEYQDCADDLYQELQEKQWDKVLKLTPSTEIFKMLDSGYKTTGYNITVNCRNETEKKYVEYNCSLDWKTVINTTDLTPYFCLYVYEIKDLIRRVKLVEGKTLYILMEKINFANYKQKILNESVLYISPASIINFITRFANLEIPSEMMPIEMEVNLNGEWLAESDQHRKQCSTGASGTSGPTQST